ncbi:hypothetical protein [Desulfovibrio aminophilus]|uniref:hypothetical protein n=1 Tax=Desulfovibrio aminophilus TaxID=81425 RepID=UPI0012EB1DC6|nr:hypothetical protein [Desulfovibrio aminophilus]
MRSGTLGEPFPADIEMKEKAKKVLESISKAHNAYDLYNAILRDADKNIQLQIEEGIEIDDEYASD